MEHNPYFKEMLQRLNAHHVDFLIVGGYAVMKYSEPRFTKDLDIWVDSSPVNGERVYAALAEWGAPLREDHVTAGDFATYNITYQIGRAPMRIDIITSIDGIRFQEAWSRRVAGRLSGENVYFISLDDLIRNKETSGRASDIEHLKQLRKK
jgi:predicted nucleotidyltransferase